MTTIAKAYQTALEHFQAGQLQPAASICEQIMHQAPEFADAWHLRGVIAGTQNQPELVVKFLEHAIRLQPERAQYHYNLAHAFQQHGQIQAAMNAYRKCLQLAPQHMSCLRNLGHLLLQQGRFSDAIQCYATAVQAAPELAGPQMSLGIAYQRHGDIDQARQCFEKAIQLQPDFAEAHMNAGLCQVKLGRLSEAIRYYQEALRLRPDLLSAQLNLGIALQQAQQFQAAEACFRDACQRHPQETEPLLKLGGLLMEMGRPKQALQLFEKVLQLDPKHSRAWLQSGHSLRQTLQYEEAAAHYRRGCEQEPDNTAALGFWLMCNMECCNWAHFDELRVRLRDRLESDWLPEQRQAPIKFSQYSSVPAENSLHPFLSLVLPVDCTAQEQLLCAQKYVRQTLGDLVTPPGSLPSQSINADASPVWRLSQDAAQRTQLGTAQPITIGYLSADFREHAVSRLAVELFEAHDRQQFRVLGYSIGRDDQSPLRKRLEAAFDVFRDCWSESHRETAEAIRRDGVDILVDLTGHTQNSRLPILAQRPAPLQVNYLGYPGTMGADFMDYIVVDHYVVPDGFAKYYSEQLVRLPGCYQANDSQRPWLDASPLSRTECGLPPDKFVFCCFNQNLKITPKQFALWMRILRRVPESVLWLLEAHPAVRVNLREYASQQGVEPERLCFAPRVEHSQHLARHHHADLFLDTLPYNAHTTGSDALWAGLPVVTQSGTTFASRVTGSLLMALRLADLIVDSPQEYEQLCVDLANQPARLAAYRQTLLAGRETEELWSGASFARKLELAFLAMWQRYRNGEKAAPLDID
ncbi:MAG: tetratricopeptide repeat protein [bacterium]|nr:tetratricopeptide repeat protein [bacterium]